QYDDGSMGLPNLATHSPASYRSVVPSLRINIGARTVPAKEWALRPATAPRITCPARFGCQGTRVEAAPLRLIPDNDFRDRRLDCLDAGVIRRELGRACYLFARLLRRLRVGPQIDADLATAGQRSERTALPVAHHADIVLVEAPQFERLALGALECRNLLAEPHALRARPGRFVVDDDQIGAGACGFVMPPHFEPPLRILRKQHGSHQRLALARIDLGEYHVLGLVGGGDLEMVRVLGE